MQNCTLCGSPIVARQNIKVTPARASEEHDGGFALGEPLRFHIRHTPDEVVGKVSSMGLGIADADSYKLTYNPPWQITDNAMVKRFVEHAKLGEAVRVIRDRTFEWFEAFPRDVILAVAAAGACLDDSALADITDLFRGKSDDELYEKCLTHNAIERLQVIAKDAEAA